MSATPSSLTLSFLRSHPEAAARVLDAMDAVEAAAFLVSVPARAAAPVLACMQPDQGAGVLRETTGIQGAALLRAMSHLDAVTLVRLLPDVHREGLYAELPTLVARAVRRSLEYPREAVGAWMEPGIAVFRPASRVSDAARYLRRHGEIAPAHVFVIGAGRRVEGAVSLASLLRHDAGMRLGDLARGAVPTLSNRALLAEVADHDGFDAFQVLPVTGRKGNVLGGLSRANLRQGLATTRPGTPAPLSAHAAPRLLGAGLVAAAGLFETVTGRRGR